MFNRSFRYHFFTYSQHTLPVVSVADAAAGKVGGRGKKHEIYVPAFGGHLLYDLFLQGREGGLDPSLPDPLLGLGDEI